MMPKAIECRLRRVRMRFCRLSSLCRVRFPLLDVDEDVCALVVELYRDIDILYFEKFSAHERIMQFDFAVFITVESHTVRTNGKPLSA